MVMKIRVMVSVRPWKRRHSNDAREDLKPGGKTNGGARRLYRAHYRHAAGTFADNPEILSYSALAKELGVPVGSARILRLSPQEIESHQRDRSQARVE
jgi:hypothetical protein